MGRRERKWLLAERGLCVRKGDIQMAWAEKDERGGLGGRNVGQSLGKWPGPSTNEPTEVSPTREGLILGLWQVGNEQEAEGRHGQERGKS